jgi:chemotaxis protein methyltransferase CheR
VNARDDELELRLLLDEIFERYHYDFRSYALSSLRRRMTFACLQLQCATLAELRARLRREAALFAQLLQYLTVQVSDMFRDPEFFLTMREQVVPVLRTYPSLKIWIAGCSTGEELYSFAILLREEGLLERTMLYATDINPAALRKAEAGIYALDRVAIFSENHRAAGGKSTLAAHYSAGYDSVVFDRTLRKNVLFADHSLATDSVFAEVHVVACRNVLIYFDHTLQERALGLVTDALCRRGFLGLGSRETLQFSKQAQRFDEVVVGRRWYRRC